MAYPIKILFSRNLQSDVQEKSFTEEKNLERVRNPEHPIAPCQDFSSKPLGEEILEFSLLTLGACWFDLVAGMIDCPLQLHLAISEL